MNWYELAALILGAGGIGGLIATIAGVIRDRRKSVTEQKGSAIEQTKETVELVDELLQKQLKWMAERLEQGETVQRKELDALRSDLGGQLSDIQVENRQQNGLLQDIVEFLNGEFQAFEEKKHPKGRKK